MEIGEIIAANILSYRKKIGFTQEQIGKFLGVDTSTVSKYETSEREISLVQIEKLADLFGIELEDLIEENSAKKTIGLAFAFRSAGTSNDEDQSKNDMSGIAEFRKIVKNYLKIKELVYGQ